MDKTPIRAQSVRHFHFSLPKIPHIPKKYIGFGIIGVVLFIGLIWYVSPFVQKFFAGLNPPIEASLIPEKEEVYKNEEFQVSMRLSSREATALELYLSYDSDIVSYALDNGEDTGFSQLTQDYFLSPLIEEVIPGSVEGQKTLHMLLVSHKGNMDVVQFNLKFKALKEGVADFITTEETRVAGASDDDTATYFDLPADVVTQVTVIGEGVDPGTCSCTGNEQTTNDCNDGYAPVCTADVDAQCTCSAITPTPTIDSGDQTPTPTPSDEPVSTPTPVSPTPTGENSGGERGDVELTLKVRFQGVTTQPAEVYRTLNTKIILSATDKTFREEKTIPFVANGDAVWIGTFSAKNLPLGSKYAIYIKGPKHLMKKVCDASPTELIPGTYKCSDGKIDLKEGSQEMDLNKIILLVGDLPQQDGIVDSLDLSFVRSNFGSKTNSTIARGDLNLDGIVDTQDMVLMLKALEFKYDED